MRIVHMTDVHFLRPTWDRGVLSKRALGLVNLYVAGRKDYFDAASLVQQAVGDALQWQADLFVMTGDVTALSGASEFEEARESFSPLLESMPSVVIPGNHDVYTRGAHRSARMEKWFGAFMSGGVWSEESRSWEGGACSPGEPVPWPVRFTLGDTDVIATNPCRPSLRSTGRFSDGAIDRAEALVTESVARGQQVVYLLHYPPVWKNGSPYDRPGHCLEDVHDLVGSLERRPPSLVLHGHKHEAWRADLPLPGGASVPIFNCGTTSAISPMDDRTAGYFVYELEGGEITQARRRILRPGKTSFEDHPSAYGRA